jgi:hypothetical protein
VFDRPPAFEQVFLVEDSFYGLGNARKKLHRAQAVQAKKRSPRARQSDGLARPQPDADEKADS